MALMVISFPFINYSQKSFYQNFNLKNWQCCLKRSLQESQKYLYECSLAAVCDRTVHLKDLLFIYTCWGAICFLFTRARMLFFSYLHAQGSYFVPIYTCKDAIFFLIHIRKGAILFLFTRARMLFFFLIYIRKGAILFLFTSARMLFFFYSHTQGSYFVPIYTCKDAIFFSYSHTQGSYFVPIYTCKDAIFVSYLRVPGSCSSLLIRFLRSTDLRNKITQNQAIVNTNCMVYYAEDAVTFVS